MARRNNKSESEGVKEPASGPVALSGYITLQSNRNRKGNKTWRALQPSDLSTSEGLGDFCNDDSSSPVDPPEPHPVDKSYSGLLPEPAFQSSTQGTQKRNNPFHLHAIHTNIVQREDSNTMDPTNGQQPISPSEDSGVVSPADTRPHVVENYLRLFGQLPDIIRLHEQTGDFDGQIVFIGHPNRDVSAHQWLSASFQWVNIGLWSHTRKRIEGSLASDRLPKSGFSYNSIDYFKYVAEHRETTIKEHGRPQTQPGNNTTQPGNNTAQQGNNTTQPTLAETKTDNTSETKTPSFAAPFATRTVTGEKLEDPFVTPAVPSRLAPMVAFKFGGGCGNAGSMDFNYEFPRRAAATNKEHQQVYIQRERERLEALRRPSTPDHETQAHLREVEFGEEAATGLTPITRVNAGRQDTIISAEDIQSRIQTTSRLLDLVQTTSRPNLPIEQRVAVPDFPINNVNARNSIPTGPTVANPYRGVSTLNAAAAPYRMPSREQPSEESDSSVTTPNVLVSVTDPALRFSDPDGIRQEHGYPIANGFNKQAPTKQNWNGPFFANSMPTAYDPTASLSLQTSNEQKLMDWCRDGQNVSRQQDYAKTLVAAAAANNKARDFGVIGKGSTKKQSLSEYEHTHLFARIYENLSEYAEESRAGGGLNYFTRAWKPAPLPLRDLGPDGNSSFYGGIPSTSPQLSRASSRPYQAYRGDSNSWGFGALASSLLPTSYGPSTTAGGAFGGSFRRGF